MPNEKEEELGIGLAPGARHYRAFVGPPEDYDLIAAMTFGLLTALGMRQHHSLLDIGCGSLRVGRLLIPYLNTGRYTGIEPNRWLVDEAIRRECGCDQIEIKKPRFVFSDDPDSVDSRRKFDFAIAQSIFTHASVDIISNWLRALSDRIEYQGALLATFAEAREDHPGIGWVYPECVSYRRETIGELAAKSGFRFRVLDWRHPRQTWALFTRGGFPTGWIDQASLSWNTGFDAGRWC